MPQVLSSAWVYVLAVWSIPQKSLHFGVHQTKLRSVVDGLDGIGVGRFGPGFYLIKNGAEKPTFHPEKNAMANPFKASPKLLLGGTLFGAGWGLAGVCPGPLYVNCGASFFGNTLGGGCLDMLLGFLVGQNFITRN